VIRFSPLKQFSIECRLSAVAGVKCNRGDGGERGKSGDRRRALERGVLPIIPRIVVASLPLPVYAWNAAL